jgi:hypothetical protein
VGGFGSFQCGEHDRGEIVRVQWLHSLQTTSGKWQEEGCSGEST